MSDPPSPSAPAGTAVYRWRDSRLEPLDDDVTGSSVLVADSWLVDDGRTLALDLHRSRFMHAVARHLGTGDSRTGPGQPGGTGNNGELDAFWDAVLDLLPATGTWFPRVELLHRREAPLLVFRHRPAPARSRSTVLATAPGPDPRRHPTIKGPDLVEMATLRERVRPLGADEAVILSAEGFVIEGAYSALLWWRGDTLCAPSPDLARVDSVTARSVLTLAAALGVDVVHEKVRPASLDGLEIWALSALHGIRIATSWVDGPAMAELPGRLALWRRRLGVLSRAAASVHS